MSAPVVERFSAVRRAFHRHPEPAWCEFATTAAVVAELREIGVDELAVGVEAYDPTDRMAVPDADERERWLERARSRDIDEELLTAMEGGTTGAVAVLERGDGPSIGLRVDIDGLLIEESRADDHLPENEGFRSEYDESMHACGHDAHMTIGLSVTEAIAESDFAGSFTVFFQPAEEVSGGGKAMAESRFAADLDYLFSVHVGLDHPTGEVVAGIEKPLAMSHVRTEFSGTSAHAGKAPNDGDNAMQAMATAIGNAYAIPRHEEGMTRVNVGTAEAGTSSNIIAEKATIRGEVRGETTELMEYMKKAFERTMHAAAEMHGCAADFEVVSESPRADSDEALVECVADVATEVEGVEQVVPWADFGASEDATFLMEKVKENGGKAIYSIVGTDHPTSHHTPTFDVDERTMPMAIALLTESIHRVARERP